MTPTEELTNTFYIGGGIGTDTTTAFGGGGGGGTDEALTEYREFDDMSMSLSQSVPQVTISVPNKHEKTKNKELDSILQSIKGLFFYFIYFLFD